MHIELGGEGNDYDLF